MQDISQQESEAICNAIADWGFCEGAIADALKIPHHRVVIGLAPNYPEGYLPDEFYYAPIGEELMPFKVMTIEEGDCKHYTIFLLSMTEKQLAHERCALVYSSLHPYTH